MAVDNVIHGSMTLVSLRLPTGLVLDIDGRSGLRGRSAFIREALEAAVSSVQAVSVAGVAKRVDRQKTESEILLDAIRVRPMTARQAAAELGWTELLAQKVSDKLGAAGLIHFPRGMGVMEAK